MVFVVERPYRVRYRQPRPAADVDVLWRIQTQRYSICVDPELEIFTTSSPELLVRWYEVKKRTPKGAWIIGDYGLRFVNLHAHKKYACETELGAVESFLARKARQIRILQTQLKSALEDEVLGGQHRTKLTEH
jgi:hypothetical protein